MSNEVLREMTKTIVDLRARIEALETAEVIPSQLQASDGDPNPCLSADASGNLAVVDGAWIGADADCSWVYDSTNGDVTTQDNVGIGTTNPLAPLQVQSTASTSGIRIVGRLDSGAHTPSLSMYDDRGTGYAGIKIEGTRNTVSGGHSIVLYTTADNAAEAASTYSARMTIDRGGAVTIGNLAGIGDVGADATGTLQAASDKRFKKELQDIGDEIDVIAGLKQLRGRFFRWNKLSEDFMTFDDVRQTGLVAQEIERVLPEAIARSTAGGDYKSVSSSKVVPFLVEVDKNQQAQIEGLSARLDALEQPRLEPK